MNKNGHSKPRHKKNHDKPKAQQTETQKKESK